MKKILVIEDENELREGVAEILNYEGYDVFQAENGNEGMTIAVKNRPDLILCDIMMPGMDGYEFLKRFKIKNINRPVPFIFITALSERLNQRRGMELGADDYLTKPFTRDELLKAIESRIEKDTFYEQYLNEKIDQIENELKNKIAFLTEELVEMEEYIEQISNEKNVLDKQLKEKEIELKEETLNAIEISIKIDNLAKIISSRLRNPKISSEQRKLLIELKSKINRRTVLSNNWTVIQLKFQQVYPDFISNLATVIPGLTRYQMIFIAATFMGLNTGQMADLLNISEDSVRKNRYRLKRKLGLGNSDDFYEYIYSLGTRGKIL
jgi:DNA-binding response OmpR family regulator/DNA-binding CsgD family transcriptional regulator